jgi:vacuolar protein sorting-associated protein 26
VKLEVGIEDCLHIEFVYDRTNFHLADVVTGRVFFLLVRIKIKLMELSLIRREAAGFPGAVQSESETLTRFEIMDGAPIRGERVPIRMFLQGLDLAPSLANVAGCLTVRYFLNLVLVDEEDRRYFKQCEVTLYRAQLSERERAAPVTKPNGPAVPSVALGR